MAYMIADVGSNHLGRLDLALAHVEAASGAGADAVKFQYFRANTDLARRPQSDLAPAYDQYVSPGEFEALEALELPDEWLAPLDDCAKAHDVALMFSCSDVSGLERVRAFGDTIKIASCDVDHVELLTCVRRLFRRAILSTGGADLAIIQNARGLLMAGGSLDLTLLYCVSEYPMPLERFDPNAIDLLRQLHGHNVGYSDHAQGWQASAWALTLGVTVLERHFVLDRTIASPDATVSSTPQEFKEIAEWAAARERWPSSLPASNMQSFASGAARRDLRRSPVARIDLAAGTTVGAKDVTYLRPAIGLDAFVFTREYAGRTLARDVPAGEYLRPSDFS